MQRTLLHVYGPFSIHSFGLMIALGLILFSWLVQRNARFNALMSRETFIDIVLVGILVAVIGCRILYLFTNWDTVTQWTDIFALWHGGLSSLGGIVAVLVALPLFLNTKKVPALPFFDLIAIYAPLLQVMTRLGCFCAGCCHGTVTHMPWGVIYTDPDSIAPLGVHIHPSQLYSALMLLLIFAFMYYVGQKLFQIPGQLVALYLVLAGLERFSTDFFRGDQEYFVQQSVHIFSISQWIALGLIVGASAMFVYVSRQYRQPYSTS